MNRSAFPAGRGEVKKGRLGLKSWLLKGQAPPAAPKVQVFQRQASAGTCPKAKKVGIKTVADPLNQV